MRVLPLKPIVFGFAVVVSAWHLSCCRASKARRRVGIIVTGEPRSFTSLASATSSRFDDMRQQWAMDVDVFIAFHGSRNATVEAIAVAHLAPVTLRWYSAASLLLTSNTTFAPACRSRFTHLRCVRAVVYWDGLVCVTIC